jgi:hypothetical protein
VSNPSRNSQRLWLALPLCALAFSLFTLSLRVRRIEYVSEVAGRQAGTAPAAWQPRLIIPGHRNESYEWLDLTRQMFDRGEIRVRHIDYENALSGREVFAASPYRWYLGVLALVHREITGDPIGESIEWSALYADPLLLFLVASLTAAFVWRRFHPLAGSILGAAMLTLYPFAAEFVPGVPDDGGFALSIVVWSILLVLTGAGLSGAPGGEVRTRRWFVAAGIVGGIGLWVSVARELPVIVGLGIGGLSAAWVFRSGPRASSEPPRPLPWFSWALAGAVTSLVAYLVEYFPDHMGTWEFRVNHPLLGLAWIGIGGLVSLGCARIQGKPSLSRSKEWAAWILAALAAASLPVGMKLIHSLSFLAVELPSMRLTLQAGTPGAASLWAWILQNGFTGAVWASLLPLLLLVPAFLIVFSRSAPPLARASVALATGPVVVAIGFALRQINWWNGVDAGLLCMVAVLLGALASLDWPAWPRALIAGAIPLFLVLGAAQLWSGTEFNASAALSEPEAVGLVERDLASWLAKHVGATGAVALAPPNLTSTLFYYAGVRGLGNFGWEDRDGLQAAVRIVSASTPEEAQELIGVHGVTHIIIPLWDPYMDAFAQIGEGQLEGTFLARLYKWNLPPWLKPVAYPIPGIAGFENQSVIVLEVVEEQDDATALSNIAVYLSEMGQFDLASKAAGALRRFPGDFGALIARAEVQGATGQASDFATSVDAIVRRLGSGGDKQLSWDQRVALAVIMAQSRHYDIARAQIRKCLAEVDAPKLRSLSTQSLFRFQILRKAIGAEISDPDLRNLSLELLPPDLRVRLQ